MRPLDAIILAAGEGTRMKSELPKVLHVICGRPMIAYALDIAASAGVKHPVVVLGHGADQVKTKLPKEGKVVIQTKQLGTGDAVSAAKRALSGTGDVLILYADTPLLRRTTVQRLIETHFKTNATCTLLTAHLADPSSYGRILRNELGAIVGIAEEAEATAAQRALREVNVGPLVCKTQALMDALATARPSTTKKELYLTHIVSHIARQEGTKIQASRVEEIAEALGINSRTELARAIGVIRQRIVDAHLHNGVTIEDAHSTFIDHGVTIGADTIIHPYTVIQTGVSIGKRCSIGPFARLRSGVAVADDVRVGNFVELVRTKIASHARINHVTYLGDTTVEQDVNIGAGTITANYDGKNKHQTHIGKGAFIGSDTVLIAPVRVGARAVTGAGSVVTRDHNIPDQGVVVGVPARLISNGKSSGRLAPSSATSEKAARVPIAAKAPAATTQRSGQAKRVVTRPAVARKHTASQKKKATRPVKRAKARPASRRVARRTSAKRVVRPPAAGRRTGKIVRAKSKARVARKARR